MFTAPFNREHSYSDFVFYAPRISRLAARYQFSPDLSSFRLKFRAQGEGDQGTRLSKVCAEIFRHHEFAMIWSAEIPCLPPGLFEQALALYPQSVTTLTRDGRVAFLSLASASYSAAVFDRIRWNTPAAGADQLKALRHAGISTVVRDKVTRFTQAKDFTRALRELEAHERTADLQDLQQTIEKITEH